MSNSFGASRRENPIIIIDSEKFQVIRRVQSQLFDSEGPVASSILSDNLDGKSTVLERFTHDGYRFVPESVFSALFLFVNSFYS